MSKTDVSGSRPALANAGIACLLGISLPLRLVFVSPLSWTAIILVACIAMAFAVSFFVLLRAEDPRFFRRLFFAFFPLHMVAVVFLSLTVAPAFFKNVFLVAASFDLIFLFRSTCFFEASRHNAMRIIIFHMPFLCAFLFWIVIIGTMVVLRLSNWEENVVSNFYHIVLCVFFIYRLTRLFPYKTVKLSGDAIIFMDIDLGNFLPAADRQVLKALILSSGHKLDCQVLSALVKQGGTGAGRSCQGESADACREKISRCPEYRTLYNKILGLKKLLEAFDLGTISTEEGRARGRIPLWCLEFNTSVRVIK